MSEDAGEKTEQPTAKKLEEAIEMGQIARSPEIQTVFVLVAGLSTLVAMGPELWRSFLEGFRFTLGHLHEYPLTLNALPGYFTSSVVVLARCLLPIMAATAVAALVAGGIQTRFRASPKALDFKWERLSPMAGFQRIFSPRAALPAAMSAGKLTLIGGMSYSVIQSILGDPIFYTAVDVARIADFLAASALRIAWRVGAVLVVIASIDYGYQLWSRGRDLMMTKEEIKEESKNAEGNPQIKSAQRRRRFANSKRKMLAEVPLADVIVTNPTHLAIALRYDRKTMKAPRIVAKGSRLNALRIREIAKEHQVPILENKPLARLMFKYGRVGGEVPAELYSAVAEVLAWVYRVNAYRYYREQSM